MMKFWKYRTAKYFYMVAGAILLLMVISILTDALQSRQVKKSFTTYMNNLRDMVFMSTYDSLKKGNMRVFKNHLEEIGTFNDVEEFSLIDTKGFVRYSSDPLLVKQADPRVIDLTAQQELSANGFSTYYFPVETTSYCSRCHFDWEIGSINSYYRLTLSRQALDAVQKSTLYYHAFTVIGGAVLIAFIYLLFMIYERKKNEEQMLLSASVRNFMDATAEPFLIIDANGTCIFCNQAGLDQLGHDTTSTLLGRDFYKTIQHSDEDGSPFPEEKRLGRSALQQGVSEVVNEALLWRADGGSFVAECRVHPIIKNGIVSGATINFFDVTEKKKEELRTMHISHLASLGELAAGVAHEINNPINGVINYAQIFKNRFKPEEEGSQMLDRIIKEGNRIAKIVFSLLHYAHQGEEKMGAVNFSQVISETMNLFQTQLNRDGIHLELDVDEKVPVVIGRFQDLEQMLMNLISNARYALNKKFPETGDPGKLLCIGLENFEHDEWPHIRLTVLDKGTGIEKEMLNKVFNPFLTTKPAGDGTGLGLHVCFSIIKQHDGKIDIDSEPGNFTRVTVDFPIADRGSKQ